MPIPDFSPTELVMLSTVFARSVRACDWSKDLDNKPGKSTVEEIQCMKVGREGLYVAANHEEHFQISAFLAAFGVSDYASFMNCMRYCHGLLSLTQPLRSGTVGKGYDHEYGELDTNITAAGQSVTTHLPPLADADWETIKRLVKITDVSALTPAQKNLAWFLKKFTQGKTQADISVSALPRPTKITFSQSGNYQGGKDFVLVNVGGEVHAELKLLSLMVPVCINNTLAVANRAITIAGLKIACKGCAPWISRFKDWIQSEYEAVITIQEARADAVRHAAAGNRPRVTLKEDEAGPYVKALFDYTKTTGNLNDVDDKVDSSTGLRQYRAI